MSQLPLVLALILIGLCGCNSQESKKEKEALLKNEQQRLCLELQIVTRTSENSLECQQFYQDLH